MNKFWREHCHHLTFLPEKYQTVDAVVFMLESIRNLRADTLTAVINLYEDELYKRKQQEASMQLLYIQKQQNEQLQNAIHTIEQSQDLLHSDLQSVQALQFFDLISK